MPRPDLQEQIIAIQQQPPAPGFKSGQQLKADDLNNVVQATKIANAMNTPRQYIAPAGGKGGGAGAVACKVWFVILTFTDANQYDLVFGGGNTPAADELSARGPFLIMARMIPGEPDIVSTDQNPIFARPLYPLAPANFDNVPWDRDGDFPVFLVWQTVYGWTLQFGEGEEWVNAPQASEICS